LFHIKGDNLYVFELTIDSIDTKNETESKTAKKNTDRIYDAGMACSMFNFRLSLTSGGSESKNEDMTILVPTEFASWFRLISNNRIFVPDTNALINRIFSAFFRSTFS
jgi:hypothetical protein